MILETVQPPPGMKFVLVQVNYKLEGMLNLRVIRPEDEDPEETRLTEEEKNRVNSYEPDVVTFLEEVFDEDENCLYMEPDDKNYQIDLSGCPTSGTSWANLFEKRLAWSRGES